MVRYFRINCLVYAINPPPHYQCFHPKKYKTQSVVVFYKVSCNLFSIDANKKCESFSQKAVLNNLVSE